MARTKVAETKGRETIAKRRENDGKASGQTRKIIAGILGEKGRDKMYKEREARTWKKGKETKGEGNTGRQESGGKKRTEGDVGGYKRPVNARNHKEGTDHQTPNEYDKHREDKEGDTKAKATSDSRGGIKTCTGQDEENDKDHNEVDKTHNGEQARERDKEDNNDPRWGAQHAKASDIEGTNAKDNTARDTKGGNNYPLVDPRPEEAPDNDDNGTLEQSTGTEGSTEHTSDVINKTPYSQYLDTNAREHKERRDNNTKDNPDRDDNGHDTYPLVDP